MIQYWTFVINPVNYYLMTTTNKRLLISESHGDLNRCTPCRGKTRPTRHVCFPRQSTYARRTLRAGGPRTWQPFMSRRQSWAGTLLPKRRAPDTILSAPADWSVGPYTASLLSQPMKQWGQSQASINDRLLGLLGPDHQHAIGTFNTCSRVPTPQSLTDIGGCYHKENPEIATAHSSPFPSEGSTDAPNWPRPVSTFNQVLTTKQKFWVLKNLWPPCGLSTTQPSTVAYIYA
jgi:hypothetical protein